MMQLLNMFNKIQYEWLNSVSFQYVLNPTFTTEQIELFDHSAKLVRAYDGTMYLPGKYSLITEY